MKHHPLAGFALALAAALIWGAQFPIAKSALVAVDAIQSSALRYIAPALILAGLLAWREGLAALRYEGRGRAAWLIGLIGMAGSPMLVFGGLMLTRPEVAAIIVATQPSMTALAEWWMRGRRPSRFTVGCVVLAFAGVVTVVTRWSATLAPSGSALVGDVMVLAGAACWVAYTLSTERFRGWSTLRLTTLTMIPGAVGGTVIAAAGVALGLLTLTPLQQWLSVGWQLGYLALIGVLVAMICWNAGTQRIGALNAMLFLNLIPLVTFLIRFLQGHRFEPIELVGAAMVISALIANNLHLRRVASERTRELDLALPPTG